ncbi:hypothetical protein BDF20DRAFT_840123 [Mycotypha africana]|uniref:uncharacterized protein n=1 Tax=Mycotypha africana TaxID=64632 RepID=UPI0022FFFBF5|nr:uncharacterized protein BDF20DRAFT_840123 [Mycotypha africana]KAI8967572.1 hypothetical protein BDF20DRAFT_840123 [Mycotypha africana]
MSAQHRAFFLSFPSRSVKMLQALIYKLPLSWFLFTVTLAILPGAAATDFGSILTAGIQDISAVAAVFGTDLVEKQCNRTLKGLQYPIFATMGMFGSLGYAKWALQTILPVQTSIRLFTPEKGQLSFECNIWMFSFGRRSCWSNEADTIAPPVAWKFFTGGIADAIRYLDLSLIKETIHQPVISASIASCLAIFASFVGLIAFTPQFLEIGLQWGPLLRCTASAVLAICNVWQPLIFAMFLVPNSPGIEGINAIGLSIAMILAGVLFVAAFALVAGYVGSFQMVQAGSTNASIIWLAIELCLMVLRLCFWSFSLSFLHYGSIRLRLDDPAPFAALSFKRWLNENETKIAFFAFGASIESIREFSNITGLWIQVPETYVAAIKNDEERKYLIKPRPAGQWRGLYGKQLQNNTLADILEAIALPLTANPDKGERTAVDVLLHDSVVFQGIHNPKSKKYQLDLIPEAQYDNRRHLKSPAVSLNGAEFHSLTELDFKSYFTMVLNYLTIKHKKSQGKCFDANC